jgi:hypothetical protein
MLALSLAAVAALALPQTAQAQDPKGHVLIVAGVGGEEQFEKEFYESGKRIVDAARTEYGIPDNQITFLAEHPERDSATIRGKSTKAEIENAFAKVAKDAKPGDVVFVVLIGHGTAQGENGSMFAAVGPDMSAQDFAKLLAPLSKQEVAFVNTTSASGEFVKTLAGKNRVVVTSTMSAMERNYSKFAKHFSAAYAGDAGDANKDGRVSLLEAYGYARQKVEQEYKSRKELQSEHARLDDNGDGTGTELADLAASDGRLAARFYMNGVTPEDPQLIAAFKQRDAVRADLDAVLARRATADAATYGQELEKALVDLVVATLKVRQVGVGGKP